MDRNKIFLMKQSEFKFSISATSYDGKTAENNRNSHVAEYHFQILIAQNEDLHEDYNQISRLSLFNTF